MRPEKATTVPATVENWEEAAQKNGTLTVDINASYHKLGASLNKTSQDLDNTPEFNLYLSALERRDAPSSGINVLGCPYQKVILKRRSEQYDKDNPFWQYALITAGTQTATRIPKEEPDSLDPKSQDILATPTVDMEERGEETLWLERRTFCVCHPGLGINCSPARVHLAFDFKQSKDKKQAKGIDSKVHSLSCTTYGLLKSRTTGWMYAILEAKARAHLRHELKVQQFGPYWIRSKADTQYVEKNTARLQNMSRQFFPLS
ncbi:hypothetical protein P168DRAFT_282967 [Aspergillus campestris IBT 28561]|uniref:Uncharacterized protein n=1 Tax=Aspergillus campestris (strain IBT 28561) TaxID=1392248 RepID=A0A2I1D004_ASPC2|nr:uncharacterized protein P168DRAFT_282967 [Aspergillus campestris IBT 28561]PKY03212.1 hypothetical protein P168DRAFT_282967 [Aspergillus campestris IBT 28561]